MHGGRDFKELTEEDTSDVRGGIMNLEKHLKNMSIYNLPCIVAINKFANTRGANVTPVLVARVIVLQGVLGCRNL